MTVVDASVFVAVYHPQDLYHQASLTWLQTHTIAGRPLVIPTLALAELAGAISRRTGDSQRGDLAVQELRALPRLYVLNIDEALGLHAASIAANLRLRGADAVYVAVADIHGIGVVSWDTEILERGGRLVTTSRPDAVQP